jgi:hypothetical protein
MGTVHKADGVEYTIVRKRVASLKPSRENRQIYDPDEEAEIEQLAASIGKNGLHQPPVVTADNWIVSGHRRHLALEKLGKRWVTCHVLQRRKDSWTPDEFLALLRDHNRQRNKTVAEQVREELIDVDPEQAHRRLCEQRYKSVLAPEYNGVPVIAIEGVKKRYGISDDKADHVKYVLQVVFEDLSDYWPLSVRGVHYALLNYQFIRGHYWPHRDHPDFGSRLELPYRNDQGSYDATSDLVTRLRLNGTIPWQAFDDFTRPMEEFFPFKDVRQFIRQEIDKLFTGYWRDLLQTQPNYVEVVCEKNTIYHMVLEVTRKYQIPTSSGRGYNSIDPWHDLYERYRASGKERLIVIVLSDYDPEGERIPHVAGQTLRDDFGVPDPTIVKAGVTPEQIEQHNLPPNNLAKEDSSLWKWFVERNGGDDTVHELEALDPEDLLADLDEVIRSVIDVDLFNRELDAEEREAAHLESIRPAAVNALKGLAD